MSTAQTIAAAETASGVPASNAGADRDDNVPGNLQGLRRLLRNSQDNLALANTTVARAQKEVEHLQREIGEIEPTVTSYRAAHPALAKDLKEIDDFVRCKLDALQRDRQTPSDAKAIETIVKGAAGEIERKRQAVDELRGLTCGAKEDCDVAAAERRLTWLKEAHTRVQSELAGCSGPRSRIESPDAEARECYALLIELQRRVRLLKTYDSQTANELQPDPDKLEAGLVAASVALDDATKAQGEKRDELEDNRRRLAQGENELAALIEDLVERILSQVSGPGSAATAQAG
ncbi:hypothetical protein L6Q96_08825 [Candidatus Binatia bacterium]|nr:hypothetical protein [Candidatus Binatia bacterium]